MKKQDIEAIFTTKAQEMLNNGLRINAATMRGSQSGEVAHIDFTDGHTIYRLSLIYNPVHGSFRLSEYDGEMYSIIIEAFNDAEKTTKQEFDTISTLRNGTGKELFRRDFYELTKARFHCNYKINGGHDKWYVDTIEEARAIYSKQISRYNIGGLEDNRILPDQYKPIALKWIKRQPRMSRTKLEDIVGVERIREEYSNIIYCVTVAKKGQFEIGPRSKE